MNIGYDDCEYQSPVRIVVIRSILSHFLTSRIMGEDIERNLENNSQSQCPNISLRGARRKLRKLFAYLTFLDRVFLR